MHSRDLAVVALIAALTGAVIGVSVATEADFGNLADWAQAVVTAIGLWFTYRLLKHELTSRREDQEERLTAQARRIEVSSAPWLRGTMLEEDTMALVGPPYEFEANGTLDNGSDEPVTKVRIVVGMTQGSTSTELGSLDAGAVGARKRSATCRAAGKLSDVEDLVFWARATFTDAQRRQWRRHADGRLEQLS